MPPSSQPDLLDELAAISSGPVEMKFYEMTFDPDCPPPLAVYLLSIGDEPVEVWDHQGGTYKLYDVNPESPHRKVLHPIPRQVANPDGHIWDLAGVLAYLKARAT